MGKFLLRRLAYLLILVVIATTATYFLAAVALNPRSNFEGRNPPPPPEVVDARLDELNLNNKTPMVDRFTRWVSGLARGDMGKTVDGDSVNDEMGRRMGVSLRLLLIGSILGSLAGVAAGAYGAVKQYGPADHAMTLVSFVILSIPTVVLAVFLANAGASFNQAVGFRLVYNTGEYAPGLEAWSAAGIMDRLQHLVLPSLTLIFQGFAFYSRYQRNSMLDVLGADFVRTARAKGLRRSQALIKHALRTALIPMGTFFAYEFALIFIGSIFVEKIFTWHGMGEWFVQSIQKNDVNATAAIGMFVAGLVLFAGFLSDMVTVALDPRIRRS
ncbi:MAG TPA: ABC transporter permease [Terriglobia bacterium]|nr:ABC transporter permease [Terriglobia bacterium]